MTTHTIPAGEPGGYADAKEGALSREMALRESRDRLARAYIIMCNYAFGPKRHNVFPLVMDAHASVSLDDLASVRDAVWAEIDEYPDYQEPEGDDDDE
jgi:hypothetical protein